MTNEEALKIINESLTQLKVIREAENYSFWEAIKTAVEKQIPKKPKSNIECVCAICKARLIPYDAEYCAYCGQKIYWEE